jgi:raffinose/stachyose/melibiose transport system substrate-binding protein
MTRENSTQLRRRRIGRTRFGVVLASVAAISVIAACSSSGGSTAGGKTSSAAGANDVTGTVKLLVSSGPQTDAAFKLVDAAFEKMYPHAHVQFTSVPVANYATAENAQIAGGSADIVTLQSVPLTPVPSFATNGSATDDQARAKAGGFVDLTGQDSLNRLTPTTLSAVAYNDKHYELPVGLSYYTGVYYNKAIFQKYNLSIPTTWAQFVTLCQTLQSDNVTPLGIGGKDVWPANLLVQSAVQGLYPSPADRLALAEGLWNQSVKFTDPTPTRVMTEVKTMFGFAQSNFTGLAYASIPAEFTSGKFAMTADGTWDAPVIAAANKSFQFGYFPIPTGDDPSDNAVLGGKVDLGLAIPSSSKDISLAEKWLDVFSSPTVYQQFVLTSGYAPVEAGISGGSFLDSIAKYTATYSPAWQQVWVPNTKSGAAVAELGFDYTGLSPMGPAKTAVDVAAVGQKAWAAGF